MPPACLDFYEAFSRCCETAPIAFLRPGFVRGVLKGRRSRAWAEVSGGQHDRRAAIGFQRTRAGVALRDIAPLIAAAQVRANRDSFASVVAAPPTFGRQVALRAVIEPARRDEVEPILRAWLLMAAAEAFGEKADVSEGKAEWPVAHMGSDQELDREWWTNVWAQGYGL